MIDYRSVLGHIEIYVNGVFFASADNMSEAYKITSEDYNDN